MHSYLRVPALVILFGTFTYSMESQATCGFLVDGLNETMDSYRAYKAENQGRLERLQSAERDCSNRGTEISAKAAGLAEALSCQAQTEVSALNVQISDLGKSCESVFREIKDLQTALHSRFAVTQEDLHGGMEIMRKERLLQKYCQDEIKAASVMAEAFLALEGNILGVKTGSATGETNFQQLKATGMELAARTRKLGENCGNSGDVQVAGVSDRARTSYGSGSATATPAPRAGNSDLTGTAEAIQDATKSNEIANSQQ